MKNFIIILSLMAFVMVGCSSGTEKKVKESQEKGAEQYDDLLKNLEQKTKSTTSTEKEIPKKELDAPKKTE